MAIAFDNQSTATQGTGTLSWTHTPIGVATSILVGVFDNLTGSDTVTGVTYGGNAMTEVTGSPFVFGTSCVIHVYALGSGVPTGNQTVVVSVSGSATTRDATALGYIADDDTTINATDSFNASGTGNLTDTLALGSVTSAVAEFGWSSGNNTLRTTPLTGWTVRDEGDFGNEIHFTYTYDTVGSSDVTYGVAHDQSETAFVVGIAIREGSGGPATHTATGSLASGSAATSGAGTRQAFASGAVAAQLASIVGAATATSPSFTAHGVDFDGSAYLTRGADMTGSADSKLFTLCLFFNAPDAAEGGNIIQNTNGRIDVQFNFTNGRFLFLARNSAGSEVLRFQTPSSLDFRDGLWHSMQVSVDQASGISLAVDDAELTPEITTFTDDTIDFTRDNWAIGANTGGTAVFPGCFGEFWFDTGVALDFSVESNRRKFIGADGYPVNLGSDGSTPTGSAPLIYLGGDGQEAAGWETNNGTGGGFTENGTLTDCATDPLVSLSHNASGALKAQASATVGAASRIAKASGSPSSQAAVTDGSATREAMANGSIESAAVVTDGTAVAGGAQIASGAVQSGPVVIDGAGVRGVNASGTPQSGFASIVGASTRGAMTVAAALRSGLARVGGLASRPGNLEITDTADLQLPIDYQLHGQAQGQNQDKPLSLRGLSPDAAARKLGKMLKF